MALTVKDALQKASKDPKFANELISNPESMKAHYGLSDAHVAQLKSLGSAASKLKTTVGGIPSYPDPQYD